MTMQVHNPVFNYGGFATITSQAGLNNYKLLLADAGARRLEGKQS